MNTTEAGPKAGPDNARRHRSTGGRRRTTRRSFSRAEISGLLDWVTVADDAVLEGDPGKAHHALLAARGWLLAKRS